jgi:hypothetical protein
MAFNIIIMKNMLKYLIIAISQLLHPLYVRSACTDPTSCIFVTTETSPSSDSSGWPLFLGGNDFSCSAISLVSTSTADLLIVSGICTDLCYSTTHLFMSFVDASAEQIGASHRLFYGDYLNMDCRFDAVTGSTDGFMVCVIASGSGVEVWKVRETDLEVMAH